jgi:uncharacterized protein
VSRRKKWLRRGAIAFATCAVLGIVGAWIVGSRLIAPAPRKIDTLPTGLPAEEVVFDSESGSAIHAWFVARSPSRGAVVLLHGLRGDRRAMLSRMRFLHAAGYTTLSIDFQGHGESPGDAITFGHVESHDARAAIAYVRSRQPGTSVAVIGESLGGAACLLGEGSPDADAYILELVYPDLHRAIVNRLAMFVGAWLGTIAAPSLTVQCELRLGIDLETMRPLDRIATLDKPVFILGGELDTRTPPGETRSLFDAAKHPKQLWIVPGAGHRNLHGHAGAEYERRVLRFLAFHLQH